jgi:hypothetical protein
MMLRDAFGPANESDTLDLALVNALNSDGTLGVDFGGGKISDPVPALDSGWTPTIGMTVACARLGTSWLVLGPTRSSNPSTVGVSASLAFPFVVLAAASGASSPVTVSASATGSWRPSGPGGWMSSDVYQGAYSTKYGFYRGCYFYGSTAFDAMAGTTCTGLTITLSRKSSGGVSGAEDVWLAPHGHASQPSTKPFFPVAARKYAGPAWGGTVTITLPTEWGQGLIDGTYAGIGHLYSGTGDYAIFNSVASDAASGRLAVSFA